MLMKKIMKKMLMGIMSVVLALSILPLGVLKPKAGGSEKFTIYLYWGDDFLDSIEESKLYKDYVDTLKNDPLMPMSEDDAKKTAMERMKKITKVYANQQDAPWIICGGTFEPIEGTPWYKFEMDISTYDNVINNASNFYFPYCEDVEGMSLKFNILELLKTKVKINQFNKMYIKFNLLKDDTTMSVFYGQHEKDPSAFHNWVAATEDTTGMDWYCDCCCQVFGSDMPGVSDNDLCKTKYAPYSSETYSDMKDLEVPKVVYACKIFLYWDESFPEKIRTLDKDGNTTYESEAYKALREYYINDYNNNYSSPTDEERKKHVNNGLMQLEKSPYLGLFYPNNSYINPQFSMNKIEGTNWSWYGIDQSTYDLIKGGQKDVSLRVSYTNCIDWQGSYLMNNETYLKKGENIFIKFNYNDGDTKPTITITKGDCIHDIDKFIEGTAPTCDKEGSKDCYSCICQQFKDTDKYNSFAKDHMLDAEGKEVTADELKLDALKHAYGEPKFTWTGFDKAKAEFVCKNDETHKETVDCTITSEITKKATTKETGIKTYTAVAKLEGKDYKDTKTEDIPKLEEPTPTPDPEPEIIKQATASCGAKLTVTWGQVKGAQGYDVFANYCGKKIKVAKTVKGAKKTSASISKLNGKKIDQKKPVSVVVKAFTMKDGKKVYISETIKMHFAGSKNKKYTEAKAIKIKNNKIKLSKGKTATIKATTVKKNAKKELLHHVAEFRYVSSDKKIATVTKKGKITAKKKGTCEIYVFANNGVMNKVKVTVK